MPFPDKIRGFLISTSWIPSWWAGPNRGRFLFSLGLVADMGIEWTFRGMQERFPLFCSEEALTWHGRDRQIFRGPAESALSYRTRLVKWRRAWRRAGTAWAILEQVQAYFAPEVPIVRLVTHSVSRDVAHWWTRGADGSEVRVEADPSNWDWDSADPFRPATLDNCDTRFWIIVYQDPNTGQIFRQYPEEDTQDPDLSWGTTAQTQKARDIVTIAKYWKAAGSWCAGLIVAFDPASFSPTGSGADYPDGTWHLYGDPDDDYAPNRLQTARYMEDVPYLL